MSVILVYPSSAHRTAKAIAAKVGIPAINLHAQKWPDNIDRYINWGCRATAPRLRGLHSFNRVNAVATAANKLACFQQMHRAGVPTPRFSDSPFRDAVMRDCYGYGGRDLTKQVKITSPFYVEWLDKAREFRVFFCTEYTRGGDDSRTRLCVREKVGDTSQDVWNRANGFTFTSIPKTQKVLRTSLYQLGREAQQAIDLDFGAVDIVMDKKNNFHVLEINTAPRLQDDLYPGELVTACLKAYAELGGEY